MNTEEVLKILEENKITNVHKKKEKEDWWERHKRYIEHRKEFPYYPEKNKEFKKFLKRSKTVTHIIGINYCD